MAAASWIRYLYLAYVAKPRSDRQLYRLVKRRRVCRIVEVGIGQLSRTVRLVELAQRLRGGEQVRYTGIDGFEARPGQLPPLSLKQAYRQLRATGASVGLSPGDPGTALAAAANSLQQTDLILIGHHVSDADLAGAWFYLPRMLNERSLILRGRIDASSEPAFVPISREEIAERAGSGRSRRAA